MLQAKEEVEALEKKMVQLENELTTTTTNLENTVRKLEEREKALQNVSVHEQDSCTPPSACSVFCFCTNPPDWFQLASKESNSCDSQTGLIPPSRDDTHAPEAQLDCQLTSRQKPLPTTLVSPQWFFHPSVA